MTAARVRRVALRKQHFGDVHHIAGDAARSRCLGAITPWSAIPEDPYDDRMVRTRQRSFIQAGQGGQCVPGPAS